jgi:Ca2+-binding RTX toxin-like protein
LVPYYLIVSTSEGSNRVEVSENAANPSLPLSVYGGQGNDTLLGGTANDSFYGLGGTDLINGGAGNDYLVTCYGIPDELAAAGVESLFGGKGNDTLVGGKGTDVLDGGAGSDTFQNFDQRDTLIGGGDNDTLTASGMIYATLTDSSLALTFYSPAAGWSSKTMAVRGFESVVLNANDSIPGTQPVLNASGFGGSVTLNGTDAADILIGGRAADVINGFGGDDLVTGGPGPDTLDGGAGHNQINESGLYIAQLTDTSLTSLRDRQTYSETDAISRFGTATLQAQINGLGFSIINASAFSGPVQLIGSGGRDILTGGRFDDTISGLEGNDELHGKNGNDQLNGDDGNDKLSGDNGLDTLSGNKGEDTLWGGANNDTLFGAEAVYAYFDGMNELHGGFNNDRLIGGNSTDRMHGDAGNDMLLGNTGFNYYYGGTGADRFLFWNGADYDRDSGSLDAIINFRDSPGNVTATVIGTTYSAASWTIPEILRADVAFADLVAETGNTRLLKSADRQTQLTMIRAGNNLSGNTYIGWNGGNNDLGFSNASLAGDEVFWSTIYHEIGHGWQGDAYDGHSNTFIQSFLATGGWITKAEYNRLSPYLKSTYTQNAAAIASRDWYYPAYKTTDDFARPYSSISPYEDFATTWETYFMAKYHGTFPTLENGVRNNYVLLKVVDVIGLTQDLAAHP